MTISLPIDPDANGDALTVHYLTERGEMLLLEGEAANGAFAVKELTALATRFGSHSEEQDKEEEQGEQEEPVEQDVLDAPQELSQGEPEDSPEGD